MLHFEPIGALDASSRTKIIDMIREAEQIIRDGEQAKRRTAVHNMMRKDYDSKPTLEEKKHCGDILRGLHSGPYFHPNFTSFAAKGPYIFGNIGRPSFGSFGKAAEAAAEEAAEAEAEAAEAASIIQDAYRTYRTYKKKTKGRQKNNQKKK